MSKNPTYRVNDPIFWTAKSNFLESKIMQNPVSRVSKPIEITTGWWFGAFIFPFSWECHHPNWRAHIFRRVGSTTSQTKSAQFIPVRTLTMRGPLVIRCFINPSNYSYNYHKNLYCEVVVRNQQTANELGHHESWCHDRRHHAPVTACLTLRRGASSNGAWERIPIAWAGSVTCSISSA